MRIAVVIGSTGLVGRLLVEKLAQDGSFSQVLAISRKSVVWSHPKIRAVQFDFQNWQTLDLQINSFAGARPSLDFFCTLGTTMKVAGSEEAFRKVDYTAVVEFSKTALRCQASSLFVISSLGADASSKSFYLRTKGQMEADVLKIKTSSVYFLRPSLLIGERTEFRFAERLSVLAAPLYSWALSGPLKKYRPVTANVVAKAMLKIASKQMTASTYVENEEIIRLGS